MVKKGTPVWTKHAGITKNLVLWVGCDLGYWTIPLVGLKTQQGLIAGSLGFLCFRIGFYWWRQSESKMVCLNRYVTYPTKDRQKMNLIYWISEHYLTWGLEDLGILKKLIEYENTNDRD